MVIEHGFMTMDKDEYKINSSDVYYSIENSIIHSNKSTEFKDSFGNGMVWGTKWEGVESREKD